jgi:hypothetical protein
MWIETGKDFFFPLFFGKMGRKKMAYEEENRSLMRLADDKIGKYRGDYDNNPPNTVSFIPGMASTSGRLRSEFVRLLFLQSHRETDRFLGTSGLRSSTCAT